ncbi:MAG: hypothetical protein HY810_06900 [Candidatus Omnitrophica bacterium]|nr:hypothetical protein [Candidatus Omnitrophota bacterium]
MDKIEAEKFVIAQMLKNGANEKEKIKNEMADIEKRKLKEDRRRNVVKVNKLIKEKANLEERLNALADKNVQLEEKLGMFDNEEKELTDKLQVITNERLKLSDKSMDLMCQWLESAQNNKTGLVPSYDKDEALLDVGYTYDQALSVFNFLYLGQEEKAKQILDFFKNRAQKVNDCFANAYDVANGGVCEYIVHSGPSIYLGLAMIKYESITHKQEYREVVNNIGQWLIALQGQRQDGALPGGPDFQWTSTEQNIAAYVFFKELFKISNDQRYAEASDKVALWLKDYGYNCKLKRFNRGKDDRMIATDIIALSILALGPEKLQQMGVDIEELVNCVEDNCKTSIVFEGLSGRKTTVTGYDFCAPSSIGREGTISIEWTSQMIVAFRELARFYENKNDLLKCKKYNLKADYYLGEMEKLLLVRTFFGKKQGAGLPYSTDSGVPTGHGWHTPDSSSISAAGTNFAIFAKEEYNIFRI